MAETEALFGPQAPLTPNWKYSVCLIVLENPWEGPTLTLSYTYMHITHFHVHMQYMNHSHGITADGYYGFLQDL